jgi:hypothetical protein
LTSFVSRLGFQNAPFSFSLLQPVISLPFFEFKFCLSASLLVAACQTRSFALQIEVFDRSALQLSAVSRPDTDNSLAASVCLLFAHAPATRKFTRPCNSNSSFQFLLFQSENNL